VHWLYRGNGNFFYTLNVNTTTRHFYFTKIPIKAHIKTLLSRPPIPCVAGGVLSFVTIQHDHGVLDLWIKQGEDNGNHDHGCEEGWQHSQLADLGSKEINFVFFAESRGALLVKQDDVFITVDLKSKEKMLLGLKFEKMEDISVTWDGENCSSTCCRGGHYGGTKCQAAAPAPVLYELDLVFSRSTFLTSPSL
jgi:hypothetical protein